MGPGVRSSGDFDGGVVELANRLWGVERCQINFVPSLSSRPVVRSRCWSGARSSAPEKSALGTLVRRRARQHPTRWDGVSWDRSQQPESHKGQRDGRGLEIEIDDGPAIRARD